MIEIEEWLRQVIGYCDLVLEEDSLRAAWQQRDFSKTSVTDFDELYEQVFDDLASDVMIQRWSEREQNVQLVQAIWEFLDALKRVDHASGSVGSRNLLATPEWDAVRQAAKAVRRLDS